VRGVASASAAVTLVNALPTGSGCAIGIERRVEARTETAAAPATTVRVEPAASGTRLASVAAELAVARYGAGPVTVSLEIQSGIPVGRGLKSSSAAASAIIRSVARALGADPADAEVAAASAGAGRASGVSATGAYDDALAGLVSGFVLTDNEADRALSVATVDSEWVAVVAIPPGVHPPSPTLREAFQREAAPGATAVHAARQGRWADAIRENTRVVERVMGYDYGDVRRRAQDAGALAVGVTGLGPAYWALTPRARARSVQGALPSELEDAFVVEFTRPQGGVR
jgi:shikimate kinase